MPSTIKRIGEIAIIVLIVINAFELAFFFAVHRAAGLYAADDQFPLPSGYLLDSRYMASGGAPCYLIRVSANGCPYCRLDQSQYARLVQQAQKVGCETIVMAPKASEAESYNDSRIAQLQYIDMKFGQALNPFMTPQTILLDNRGRVIWFREGTMDDGSLPHAIQALDKLR